MRFWQSGEATQASVHPNIFVAAISALNQAARYAVEKLALA
jgi:hypothetical protein